MGDNSGVRRYILTANCPDRSGVVAAVTGFIAGHGGWVLEAAQHSDLSTQTFFLRIEIIAESLNLSRSEFEKQFGLVAEDLSMTWHLTDTSVRKKMILLASKEEHCVSDLLSRWRSGDLQVDIPLVIANHENLRSLVEFHGIEFLYLPMTEKSKGSAFAQIGARIDELSPDLVVLARFMQIMPANLCDRYAGKMLNIHHSFLPSFAGARPYHQAFDRGVKLIGATCHYVTAELDEGPIIEQDIQRIDHTDDVEELMRVGRDVERTVLARGVRWHLEDRVLINGIRTVVFS
jgi:formyltetrahydrofolate deformylase